jgi:diaminohydroxyphosphoribosylaminopyrimidine deaminase/5-amino-6-(5-phosphoribosylamino)uracil reductase
MIAGPGKSRVQISNSYTNRMVHQWRSKESAILVGTQTALLDDPQLTSRIEGGKQPVRLVIDRDLLLPHSLQLFNTSAPTIVFNSRVEKQTDNIYYCLLGADKDYLPAMLRKLYSLQIQSVLVEGGKVLLDSFLKSGLWDEVRRISATDKLEINGYAAPGFAVNQISQTILLENDKIDIITANHF